jgi:hypothetical protein
MRIMTTQAIGFSSFLMATMLCLLAPHVAYGQQYKPVAAQTHINFLTNYIPVFYYNGNHSLSVYGVASQDNLEIGPVFFFRKNFTTDSTSSLAALDSLLQYGDLVINEDTAKVDVNEGVYDTLAMAYLYSMYDAESEKMVNKYAEMVEVEPEEIKNLPLYRFIDHWYGVKYKYGGTSRKGIDCSAFSQRLYGNVYCTNIKRTSKQQYKKCERREDLSEAGEGDLVFFRINRVRISHVGVYLANGYFVHATRSKGIMISSLDDKYWQRRYAGCGRVNRPYAHTAESDFSD